MLEAYFDGVRETVILIPKKNGKTALLAALGLYHLETVADPDVCIVAASREQAMKLFDSARGFVRRSRLRLHVLRGYREIRLPDPDREDDSRHFVGLMKVYANDADTFDGWLGTLGLVDELHRHKDEETYGLVRDGLGPRGGQMLTISTAGDNEVSPLGRLRSRAYALPGMGREDAHRFVQTEDFAYHEWALDHDESSDDLGLVKLANPASWMTAGLLRERHDSPSTRPWQFDRFAAGKWSSGEHSAVSPREWQACADASAARVPGGSAGVIVGCDLSQKDDKSAFVPVWAREDGIVVVHEPVVLTPPSDGTSLLFEDMLEACREMATVWPGCTFVLDPLAGGEYLAQLIDRELPGVRVATYSQAHGPMCLASERLATGIAERRLVHPDDPELNAHVLGAASKQVAEKWRFAKPRGRDVKIDACIALAMAYSTLVAEKPRKAYRTAGFS
jgi:phage terminase large subunit-like protein